MFFNLLQIYFENFILNFPDEFDRLFQPCYIESQLNYKMKIRWRFN